MAIKTRSAGDVTILDVSGKITIGVGEVELRSAVQGALDDRATKLVLNLTGVTAVDSSGVGEMVSSCSAATGRGCKLVLANLPPKVSYILTITQLIAVFDAFESEDEAVASFN